MRAIGIEISKKRAIYFAIEKDEHGNYSNITGNPKYIEIKDDQDNDDIREFQIKIHALFDKLMPDTIAVLTRQTKGRFASSPISFKLEGLIQCYQNVQVSFVAPKAVASFYKKNTLTVPFDNNYQENAAKLSFYLLNK
jgi:hypothetical protein